MNAIPTGTPKAVVCR